MPLSKGTVHHQGLPNNLKKSATSSKKETRHYTKLGNGIMTFCINAPLMTAITIRRGAHLDKDFPLKEEVKSIKEAKYGEFGRPSPFSNGAKYRVDMTKRSPIGIVENILVKIDKFLFPSDFVVMDMLNTRNETMILGRPFLATIHAEIDVFNKEISLGIGGDRVTFDMDKKIHNFTTSIGEIVGN
ncbi:putative reverse transcriptase domain-containing protein [Tanacetum coccineum]